MRIPDPDRRNPAEARRAIAADKLNKPFVAALLDRDHPDHRPATDRPLAPVDVTVGRADGSVAGGVGHVRNPGSAADAGNPAKPVKNRLRDNREGERNGSSDDRRSEEPPVINMAADRIQAILDDAPARFEIRDNPDADASRRLAESPRTGIGAVRLYERIIEREASRQGVDPDLVKAIVYMENAHWNAIQLMSDEFRVSTSVLPMNIQPETWAGLAGAPINFHDPVQNIRAGVTLIRRIRDRIDNPTPAKIASIWIFTGRELVNDYGARAQAIYEAKPWLSPTRPRRRR